jgi:hypothetical protein
MIRTPAATRSPHASTTPENDMPRGVAVVAITPGFLRSESMLQHMGVTEDNCATPGRRTRTSCSPSRRGSSAAALAADPQVMDRTGMLWSSWELARHYQFTDYDGRRLDWGRHAIDFSGLPTSLVDLFRTGTDLEMT